MLGPSSIEAMPYLEVEDVRLGYREFGTQHGAKRPVLGIMGFAMDARMWAAQVPAVTQHRRFVTFDNRGTGRSTGPPITTIADMATDALALIDHLETDKAVLFGLSMGGAVAQQLALDHPERVEALILGVTWARPIEFMRRQHLLARFVIENGGPTTLTESSLIRMFTPEFFEVGADMVDQLVSYVMTQGKPDLPDREVLLAQLDALDKHDVLDRLGELNVPTLVLGGKMDMMVPGFASQEIAAAIPGAQLAMFETGHGCMVEEMQPFNDAISRFLVSLEGS